MRSFGSRHARPLAWAAAALVVLGAFGLWLRGSSLVRVEQVTVTGVEGSQAGAIRDALVAAARDMTTLNADDDELLAAVSNYPLVRSVRSSAGLPHRLRIMVNAYEPVAAVRAHGTAPTAVAADGKLLRGTPTKGLAVVSIKTLPGGDGVGDPAALGAIRLVATAPVALRKRVQRVYRGDRGLAAVVADGPKLYFGGASRPRAQWIAAAHVLADQSARGATYVDVRIPERPVAGGFQPRQVSPSTLG
jgi:cell division protein FtsQ